MRALLEACLENINENANHNRGIGFLHDSLGAENIKKIWLQHYGRLGKLHMDGDLHIHDMDMLAPYAISINTGNILNNSACDNINALFDHLFYFFIGMQREWAGAIHLEFFNTTIAKYAYLWSTSKNELISALRTFLSEIAAYTDYHHGFLSIDLDIDDSKTHEYKDTVHIFNECLYLVLNEGIHGKPFVFPIVHIKVTDNFFKLNYTNDICKNALTFGNTYFHNFMNNANEINRFCNMCCRLRVDKKDESSIVNGSIGCVTINMARIGHLAKSKQELFSRISELVLASINILRKKEKLLNELLEKGLYPLSCKYQVKFESFYKTIGVNGINEMIMNFSKGRFDIFSENGVLLAEKILKYIRNSIAEFKKEWELIHLEATPCEGASPRFARSDIRNYNGDIFFVGTNEKEAHYTNSSQIPDGYSNDLCASLENQTPLQRYYDGGTVFHIFINGDEYTPESSAKLLKRLFLKFHIPTVTYSSSFYVCNTHGYSKNNQSNEFCPKCGNKMQKWGRVMGYMRPVDNFSASKKNEFFSRKIFNVKQEEEHE